MQKEILFKAYDKFDKKFYKVQSIDFNCLGEIETITVFKNDSLLKSYNKNHKSDLWNIDALILCRYTGLKDKNGVKIFENDIMKNKRGGIGIVKCTEYAEFILDFVDDINMSGFCPAILRKYEVIGNIFDKGEDK